MGDDGYRRALAAGAGWSQPRGTQRRRRGAGQSREPGPVSPRLLGVSDSLVTGDRAPHQQKGRRSHTAPLLCSSHCDTQRGNPITWKEPQRPRLQHPQPEGHPKMSPLPGQAPLSAPAVRESCHPVPSHLLLPNFFFFRKQLTLFFEEQQMSETLPAPFMMLNLLPGSTIAILMTNAPTALTRLSAGIENRSRGGHAVSGLLEENEFQLFS